MLAKLLQCAAIKLHFLKPLSNNQTASNLKWGGVNWGSRNVSFPVIENLNLKKKRFVSLDFSFSHTFSPKLCFSIVRTEWDSDSLVILPRRRYFRVEDCYRNLIENLLHESSLSCIPSWKLLATKFILGIFHPFHFLLLEMSFFEAIPWSCVRDCTWMFVPSLSFLKNLK